MYALEEIRMVREFQPGDEVWWTKKGFVHHGKVVRLKTRKLVVNDPESRGANGYWVLPVRKVKRGPVPKEYLHPDSKRWRVGRVKGGGARLAEAVVQ